MIRSYLLIAIALCLASLAAPLALVIGGMNAADPADLYVILSLNIQGASDPRILDFGARDIGPETGAMARLIFAPPEARTLLLADGYLMLPANRFAAICGFDTALPFSQPRNI